MQIITISGTAIKRRLSEFLVEAIENAWLLALEGNETEEECEGEKVSGSELETAIGASDMIPAGSVVLVEANVVFSGMTPTLAILVTDVPLDKLETGARAAAGHVDLVLIEAGTRFDPASLRNLESPVKSATGAWKVLIFDDEKGCQRVFLKTLDIVRSRLEGAKMPDDIPEKVIEAVKKEASEGRIGCERAQALAGDLDVSMDVIGRALDLLGIKIINCQLGCF